MWEDFMLSLEVMGKGMASIFIVIIALTLIVMFLAKISTNKKKDDSEKE